MSDLIGVPGDEFTFKESDMELTMTLLRITSDRYWFSNGFSFDLDFKGLEKTGVHKNSFTSSKSLWIFFTSAHLTGDISQLNPGDMVLIFNEPKGVITTDILAVKDSDRKMFVTCDGVILSFFENRVMFSGYSIKLEDLKLCDEAAHFVHQLYE